MAPQLEAGTIFMNRCDYLDPYLPWTGVKDTGKGVSLRFKHTDIRSSLAFSDFLFFFFPAITGLRVSPGSRDTTLSYKIVFLSHLMLFHFLFFLFFSFSFFTFPPRRKKINKK